jgi:glycosyltransferase involved in cell wall biosynthesis
VGVIAVIQRALLSRDFLENKKLWFSFSKSESAQGATYTSYLFTIPLPFSIKRKYINYRCYLNVKKYISDHGKPDLIHLQTYEMGPAALRIKKKLGIPYIITEHSSNLYENNTRLKNKLLQNIYDRSECNIAVSPYFANFLSEKFKNKFRYIPNSIDLTIFNPIRKDESKIVRLLHVAHTVPIKQQNFLLEALKLALESQGNIHLTIIGDGPELKELKALALKLEIDKHVSFLGRLSNEEVRDWMQQSDIFILTSKKETFGVVLIEAMATGLPCISTKCGGPEGIIINKDLGLLCEQNSEAISSAIVEACSKKYDFKKISTHARKTYSKETVSDKISQIYNQVILKNKI